MQRNKVEICSFEGSGSWYTWSSLPVINHVKFKLPKEVSPIIIEKKEIYTAFSICKCIKLCLLSHFQVTSIASYHTQRTCQLAWYVTALCSSSVSILVWDIIAPSGSTQYLFQNVCDVAIVFILSTIKKTRSINSREK